MMARNKWPNWIPVNNIYNKGVRSLSLFAFSKARTRAILRIGPHNKDVLSIIFGSLLGDAYAEKRAGGLGTIIIFYQEAVHVGYLYYLHKLFSNLGYCNPKIPVVTSRLGPKGKLRQIVRFRT